MTISHITLVAPVAAVCFAFGPGGAASAHEAQWLKESFAPGYQYHVSSRVDISGSLTLPPEMGKAGARELTVTGTSAVDYDERVLGLGSDGKVQKAVRYFQRIDFQRKVGDQLQQFALRPEIRRMVLLRHKQAEVPFSPAGPLTWGEIDLVRTDVFTPALAGLLPGQPVKPGDSWPAAPEALAELTDLEKVDEGGVVCKLEAFTTLANRRHARVALQGTVGGLGEDGPTRHRLEGFFLFDLESNHLGYLSLKGTQSLLDPSKKVLGTVEGTFVLTRNPTLATRELAEESLRGLKLEPSDDNTQLLYDNPDLGIRFLYPRRWRVGVVAGRQITLDESRGSGLLLTVEPGNRVPTGAQFLNEAQTWLRKEKAALMRTLPPQRIPGTDLEHFALEAEMAGQRVWLDYFVIRQPAGGVTLVARLLPGELAELQREVGRIARSIQLYRPQ